MVRLIIGLGIAALAILVGGYILMFVVFAIVDGIKSRD